MQLLSVGDIALIDGINQHIKDHSCGIYNEVPRFDSWVNRCWSPIRKLILADGEPTIEADISASHPSIICVLAEKRFGKQNDDVRHFRQLVEQGTVYKHLQRATGRDDLHKAIWKDRFLFPFLFGEPKKTYHYALSKVLREEFPTIWKTIDQHKTFNNRENDKHTYLSVLCQILEAEIMLEDVCGKIMADYPGTFVIPVHDSVICKYSDRQIVEEYMKMAWSRFGILPHIKA